MSQYFNIRPSSIIVRRSIQLIDISALTFTSWLIYFAYVNPARVNINQHYFLVTVIGGLLYLLTSSAIYRIWRGGSIGSMLSRATISWWVSWTLTVLGMVFGQITEEFSRVWLASWLFFGTIAIWLAGIGVKAGLGWLGRSGYFDRKVLLIGATPSTRFLERRIQVATWPKYSLTQLKNDQLDKIEKISSKYPFDEVWINLPLNDTEGIENTLHALRYSSANIRFIPDLFAFRLMNHGVSMIMGTPMLDLSHTPINGFNVLLKSIEDRVLSFLILLLISPLLIAIAIGVKLSSPGPIFFRQKRHGWNNQTIEMYKFRSMMIHNEAPGVVTQARLHDTRVTKFGAFLRRTSLDELPQFFNVLQGKMSIVGPRPHAVSHNHHYRDLIPHYMLRHKVKPGITGWAQINGYRGETDTIDKMQKRVEFDLFYIENWSLFLDLKIIFMTVFKGFNDQNAY